MPASVQLLPVKEQFTYPAPELRLFPRDHTSKDWLQRVIRLFFTWTFFHPMKSFSCSP